MAYLFIQTNHLPLISILIANLIPVFGVLYWGWNLSVLLFLYWLESLAIGAVNLVLISVSNATVQNRFKTSLFFILHYGLFWVAHGLFLFMWLIPEIQTYSGHDAGQIAASAQTLKWVFYGMVASHVIGAISYLLSRPREQRLSPTEQLFAPYGRVFVMHIVILGGAWLSARYSNIIVVVLLFTGLKIAFELLMILIREKQLANIPQTHRID